jgi:hypothetical protein
MIFRVEICLLKAEPDRLPEADVNEEVPWHYIYRVTSGVNAPGISAAVSIATTAFSESEDEDGTYLGGVVIELRAKVVAPSEFEGYAEYLIQPMEMPGLFYVSGRTHSVTSDATAAPVLDALARVRERRKLKKDGPMPRFVFRRHPRELTPKHFRMVCPVCRHWREFDHLGSMFSLYSGLTEQDEEYQRGQETAKCAREFVERHLRCVMEFGDDGSGLLCLYDNDERYQKLDSFHEENW